MICLSSAGISAHSRSVTFTTPAHSHDHMPQACVTLTREEEMEPLHRTRLERLCHKDSKQTAKTLIETMDPCGSSAQHSYNRSIAHPCTGFKVTPQRQPTKGAGEAKLQSKYAAVSNAKQEPGSRHSGQSHLGHQLHHTAHLTNRTTMVSTTAQPTVAQGNNRQVSHHLISFLH